MRRRTRSADKRRRATLRSQGVASFGPDTLDVLELQVERLRGDVGLACRAARVARQEVYLLAAHGHDRCARILDRAAQIRTAPRPRGCSRRECGQCYPPLAQWDAEIDAEDQEQDQDAA